MVAAPAQASPARGAPPPEGDRAAVDDPESPLSRTLFGRDWSEPPSNGFLEPWKKAGRAVFRILFGLDAWGLEHIPREGPFIVVANHPSYVDPLMVGAWLRGIPQRIMTWDAVFRAPLLGLWVRKAGAFPVPLHTPRGTIMANRLSEKILERGGVLLLFPEGGRSKATGEMHSFKPGIGRLVARVGCPVVPVSVLGNWRVWPLSSTWFRPAKSRLVFHAPLVLDEDERRARQRDRTYQEAIVRALDERIRRTVEAVRLDPRSRKGQLFPPVDWRDPPTVRPRGEDS